MADIAISVESLGKRYRIGRQETRDTRITEALSGVLRAPINLVRRRRPSPNDWIWALRDVSFEIHRGDVVGVIGRNGSGKTTLLKVLSRITEPTAGSARLNGRVGSLLEVGTGFHQELTGRENVFMSGAVLGMRRAEIIRRFDEIAEFAGIDQFLDTPVKHYSSGMQVRLGFAVAAHLDPEILFIDEVLAVGDAEFQKKCLGKMSELGKGGRTIVFVSHSMPAMLRLCEQAILLDHGRLVTAGPTHEVVRAYLESDLGRTSHRLWDDPSTAPGDEVARLRSVRVVTERGDQGDEVDIREPIQIETVYSSAEPGSVRPMVILHFYNDDGTCLFVTNDTVNREWRAAARQPGVVTASVRIPGNLLAEGRITVTAEVTSNDSSVVHAREADAIAFQVVDRSEGDGVRGDYSRLWPGVMRPMLDWTVALAPDPRRP
jgi:lipopolysaccharide transport system ATP-binding protein